jgi:hypothetical protein
MYADDILIIYNSEHINTDMTLTAFNRVHPKLTLILEKEHNGQLIFSYLTILRITASLQLTQAAHFCNFHVTRNFRVVQEDQEGILSSWSSHSLKMGPIGYTETSVQKYHSRLRNIPEEQRYSNLSKGK